jgi:predicted nucleic acid-binding protein
VIVVADTSVLINLCRAGQGGLFRSLFHEVIIPPEVVKEFTRLAMTIPRFNGLKLPDGIREQSPRVLSPMVRMASGLDAGEAAALSLAVEIHADAVLLDERRGYEVAIQLGLPSHWSTGYFVARKGSRFFT